MAALNDLKRLLKEPSLERGTVFRLSGGYAYVSTKKGTVRSRIPPGLLIGDKDAVLLENGIIKGRLYVSTSRVVAV